MTKISMVLSLSPH